MLGTLFVALVVFGAVGGALYWLVKQEKTEASSDVGEDVSADVTPEPADEAPAAVRTIYEAPVRSEASAVYEKPTPPAEPKKRRASKPKAEPKEAPKRRRGKKTTG